MTPGGLDRAQLLNVPPLDVGRIHAQKGSPHVFRVIGENNWVERFTGNRRQRAMVLEVWREPDAAVREAMWAKMQAGGWLSPYASPARHELRALKAAVQKGMRG